MTDPFFARLDGREVALIAISCSDARAIIDAEDAPLVAGRPWKLHDDGYAQSRLPGPGDSSSIYMHHLMVPVSDGLTVDHENGNRLDNRRANLRAATRAQQQYNRGRGCNNTSGFKGVSFHRKTGRWRATIQLDGRHRHLGLFDDAETAARAYDDAALAAWGEWARTNFETAGVR